MDFGLQRIKRNRERAYDGFFPPKPKLLRQPSLSPRNQNSALGDYRARRWKMERSSDFAEPVIDILRSRGWCFPEEEQVRILITISSALVDDGDTYRIADSVEAELLNMDIRSIGAKSLPDPTQLKKSSRLQGPRILQATLFSPLLGFVWLPRKLKRKRVELRR